jgi:hypothetical protein
LQIPDFESRRPVTRAVARRRKGRRCALQESRGENGKQACGEPPKTMQHGNAIRHVPGA